MATQVINPVGLSDLILDEVRQHGDRPLNELLVTMSGHGHSRSEVKEAFVELLNEGDLILTADRKLAVPANATLMALAHR
jgi:hypothetical protein